MPPNQRIGDQYLYTHLTFHGHLRLINQAVNFYLARRHTSLPLLESFLACRLLRRPRLSLLL